MKRCPKCNSDDIAHETVYDTNALIEDEYEICLKCGYKERGGAVKKRYFAKFIIRLMLHNPVLPTNVNLAFVMGLLKTIDMKSFPRRGGHGAG